MKHLIIAAAGILIASAASAADLPRSYNKVVAQAPITYWNGFYAGVGIGYGQSAKDTAILGTEPIAQTIIGTGIIPGSIDPNEQGWTFGGQIGYRWQTGAFVFGGEAEFNWSGIDGSKNSTFTAAPLLPISLDTAHSSQLEWYGTVTGQVGIAFDRTLIYAKGGFAYGDVNHQTSHTLRTPIPALNVSASGSAKADTGYLLGGGVEFAVLQNWSLGFEYNYLDFGKESVAYSTSVLGTPVGFLAERDNVYHIVKGRLNYRF